MKTRPPEASNIMTVSASWTPWSSWVPQSKPCHCRSVGYFLIWGGEVVPSPLWEPRPRSTDLLPLGCASLRTSFRSSVLREMPISCPSLGNPSSNGRPSTSVRHPYVDDRLLEDGLPRLVLMPYLNSNASSSSLPAVWKEDSKSQQTTTVCSKH